MPIPSPVDHILSELSTMTRPSWVVLHGLAHSFIELDKAVVHVIRLTSFCDGSFQSVCPLMPSISAYCVTGIPLTLDVGYLLKAGPLKRSCLYCPSPWGIFSWRLATPVSGTSGQYYSASWQPLHCYVNTANGLDCAQSPETCIPRKLM